MFVSDRYVYLFDFSLYIQVYVNTECVNSYLVNFLFPISYHSHLAVNAIVHDLYVVKLSVSETANWDVKEKISPESVFLLN